MKRIWIVDDEADYRTLIKLMLKKEGFEVKGVENGTKCLELIKSGDYPDLILLDVMMPDMDGWEVCKTIKKNRAISSIPICILTAKSAPYDVHMSLNKARANWHLNKPINREKLLEAIEWLTTGSLNKQP